MNTPLGRLLMVPVPLADEGLKTIPEEVKQMAVSIKYFFVENIRTARRYLKSIDKSVDIDAIRFSEINAQTEPDLALLRQWLRAGHEVGVMSEAGCPGIADPGSVLAAEAQQLGATVVPLVGPSSILLALMASGFNGQGFRFAGYLPVKEPMRGKAIKELELLATQRKEAQIFIETPYRNNQMLQELLRQLKHATKLCIAAHLTGEKQWAKTKTVAQWAAAPPPELHKQPVIFLIG
ncbi:MAG: SAM-dependent methyltransferase [Edaphocola sp.]